jgi:hypothetical protein
MKSVHFFSLLILLFSQLSFAGGNRVGNGGAAWVCREADHSIRWAELVDLFEAQNDYGLTLQNFQGSYEKIVDQVSARIEKVLPLLQVKLNVFQGSLDYIQQLHYLKETDYENHYIDYPIAVVNDSLYRSVPSSSLCLKGTIQYEQVVETIDTGIQMSDGDDYLTIQRQLFNALSEESKAALVIHEGVYAYDRKPLSDGNSTTSIDARRTVGLLFSSISDVELLTAVNRPNYENEIDVGNYTFDIEQMVAGLALAPLHNVSIRLSGNYVNQPSSEFGSTITKTDSQIISIPQKNGVKFIKNPSVTLVLDGIDYSSDVPFEGFASPLNGPGGSSDFHICAVYFLSLAHPGHDGHFTVVCGNNLSVQF